MENSPLTYPTFARELLEARATLTLSDEVGLALRLHRRRLGKSQRAYAAVRGWSRSHLGRLEATAGRMRLEDVVAALQPTGFRLALIPRNEGGPSPDERRHPAGLAGAP